MNTRCAVDAGAREWNTAMETVAYTAPATSRGHRQRAAEAALEEPAYPALDRAAPPAPRRGRTPLAMRGGDTRRALTPGGYVRVVSHLS